METKKEPEEDGQLKVIRADNDGSSEDDSDTNNSAYLPAISPISSSSGIFSCGSASSSNFASTPTNLQLTDKSDDECLCPVNNSKKTATIDDVIVIGTDNEDDREELAITERCDSEQFESDNKNNGVHSTSEGSSIKASTSKSVKIRLKHRHSRKSLDDEIVIYESDSSLQVDSRHRNVHPMYSNRAVHQNTSRETTAISRRKSEENSIQPSNQIVSILKRKDSSTSSNASLVTFSPNVIDIEPTSSRRTTHRQGILKKRSSLDESLRYSRSHSPSSASSESEKGCLVRNNRRRNSSEEINHHGILKQKSYDSSGGGSAAGYSSGIGGSSGGYNTPNSSSSYVQGILKKPSLTPSDHNEQPAKHVSISEAVILAAAELCKDMIIIDDCHSESYIKPILKLDHNDHHQHQERKPKPILKKNHSNENEEIRSILKSRKSSREESLQDDS